MEYEVACVLFLWKHRGKTIVLSNSDTIDNGMHKMGQRGL